MKKQTFVGLSAMALLALSACGGLGSSLANSAPLSSDVSSKASSLPDSHDSISSLLNSGSTSNIDGPAGGSSSSSNKGISKNSVPGGIPTTSTSQAPQTWMDSELEF